MQTDGENIQLCSLLQCTLTRTLLLPASLGPNNPVCSRPCTENSALGASTICTLSRLASEHCGGALLEAIESDLIPTLAFCQQRLHSDERNGSFGQTDLLLYVSCGQIEYVQVGLELCFSCQKQVWITAGPATTPPEWSFISSQHCHKVNTSSAIAPCFLDMSCCSFRRPLSSCAMPYTLLLKCPTFCLDFTYPLHEPVAGPAEKPPPGVRSGVIYHSRLCGELTFVQAFCSAIVIDSPCLFEDTNSYNYVRTPLGYILPISLRKTTGELSFCIS